MFRVSSLQRKNRRSEAMKVAGQTYNPTRVCTFSRMNRTHFWLLNLYDVLSIKPRGSLLAAFLMRVSSKRYYFGSVRYL